MDRLSTDDQKSCSHEMVNTDKDAGLGGWKSAFQFGYVKFEVSVTLDILVSGLHGTHESGLRIINTQILSNPCHWMG